MPRLINPDSSIIFTIIYGSFCSLKPTVENTLNFILLCAQQSVALNQVHLCCVLTRTLQEMIFLSFFFFVCHMKISQMKTFIGREHLVSLQTRVIKDYMTQCQGLSHCISIDTLIILLSRLIVVGSLWQAIATVGIIYTTELSTCLLRGVWNVNNLAVY